MKNNSKRGYVYIMASDSGVIYIGVTSNLIRRVWEHKQGVIKGFSKKYKIHKLVYYEIAEEIYSTIEREKQIKKWRREKKIELINSINPEWRDLSNDFSFDN